MKNKVDHLPMTRLNTNNGSLDLNTLDIERTVD